VAAEANEEERSAARWRRRGVLPACDPIGTERIHVASDLLDIGAVDEARIDRILLPQAVHFTELFPRRVGAAEPVEDLAADLAAAGEDHRVQRLVDLGQRLLEAGFARELQRAQEVQRLGRGTVALGPVDQRGQVLLAIGPLEQIAEAEIGAGQPRLERKRAFEALFGELEAIAEGRPGRSRSGCWRRRARAGLRSRARRSCRPRGRRVCRGSTAFPRPLRRRGAAE